MPSSSGKICAPPTFTDNSHLPNIAYDLIKRDPKRLHAGAPRVLGAETLRRPLCLSLARRGFMPIVDEKGHEIARKRRQSLEAAGAQTGCDRRVLIVDRNDGDRHGLCLAANRGFRADTNPDPRFNQAANGRVADYPYPGTNLHAERIGGLVQGPRQWAAFRELDELVLEGLGKRDLCQSGNWVIERADEAEPCLPAGQDFEGLRPDIPHDDADVRIPGRHPPDDFAAEHFAQVKAHVGMSRDVT